jgi:ABC-type sugar transport system ATPase subunit
MHAAMVGRMNAATASVSSGAPVLGAGTGGNRREDRGAENVIRVRNVSKSFPGVQALRRVSFDLKAGEVHGLVGANGAGKSTLIRILAGATTPDEGEIEVQGQATTLANPRQVRAAGIAAIYQELTIVPEMSVLSNVFLGAVPTTGLFSDRKRMERRFAELAAWMGVKIGPYQRAGSLAVASQQMIEIMRAIEADHRVLIMDEPTAPLGPFERAKLYDLIAQLKARGTAIIFISHDLDEVLKLCDRVSVMRDGELIMTDAAALLSKEALVGAMLGTTSAPAASVAASTLGEEILSVRDLSLDGQDAGLSLRVRAGEVLGIAGLVGSGRTEVLRALAGADAAASGMLAIDGVSRPWPRNVREAIGLGIALAPEDRKHQGLVLDRSALFNLTLSDFKGVAVGPFIDKMARSRAGRLLSAAVGFDVARLGAHARTLSGGNQQKLVIGKWLHRRPRVLLLDEPTRGIDIGAKQEIFRTIRELTADKIGVILVSSDLEEVVEHVDTVLVLARGKQIALLDRAEASVERILRLIFTVENRAA